MLRRLILMSIGIGFGLLLSALLSQRAQAFTITEMRALSAQHEPLRVQLLITELDSRVADQLSVRVADASDHERYGMTRPEWSEQVQFLVQSLGAERTRILIDAPYNPDSHLASMLLEFAWPGRLRIQQIGVRLPAQAVPALTRGAIDAVPPSVVVPVVPASPEARPFAKATTAEASTVVIPARGDQIRVRTGDTLSQIANQWEAPGLTLAQKAKVIAEQNPRAFINGNPNLLRMDARLTLPSPDTLPVPDVQEAQDWLAQAPAAADSLAQAVMADSPSVDATSDDSSAPQEITLTLIGEGAASRGSSHGESGLGDSEEEQRQALLQRGSELTDRREQLRQRLSAVKAENEDLEQRLTLVDERLAAMTEQLSVINEHEGVFIESESELESGFEPQVMASDVSEEWSEPVFESESESSGLKNMPGHTLFAWLLLLLLVVFLLVMNLFSRLFGRQPQVAPVVERQEPAIVPVILPAVVAEPESEESVPAPAAEPVPEQPLPVFDTVDPDEDEYDFMTDAQEQAQQTRLDLAQAYIEMKLDDSARHLLNVVAEQGTEAQRETARALLKKLD